MNISSGRHVTSALKPYPFITFDGVVSETDDLPVDTERRNWSAEALSEKMRRPPQRKRSIKTM